MTNYTYSQQIHDKILNDWKDIPFDEWKFVGNIISHPSVKLTLEKLRSWTKVRKYLKTFGLTRGEQDKVIDKLGIKDSLK